MSYKKAAGILIFCSSDSTIGDSTTSILLGKEYRDRYNNYFWMDFGGKNEEGETLVETAFRECNEETANSLNIKFSDVLEAEEKGYYIDYLNKNTNMFYRMYCVKLSDKINIEIITKNVSKIRNENPLDNHVEKLEYKYFNAHDVIFSEDGTLPDDEYKIYSTSFIRYKLLKDSSFLKEFI